MRDFRGDLRALGRVLVPTGEGRGRFRLEQLATITKEGRMHSLAERHEALKRIAAPMIGGIFTSFLLELLVYPPIYKTWKWNTEVKRQPTP